MDLSSFVLLGEYGKPKSIYSNEIKFFVRFCTVLSGYTAKGYDTHNPANIHNFDNQPVVSFQRLESSVIDER
jgi:hypothetical protein